jgi:hypothetical protein
MLQGHTTESSRSCRNRAKNYSAADDLWLFDGAATEMGVSPQRTTRWNSINGKRLLSESPQWNEENRTDAVTAPQPKDNGAP